MRSVTTKVWLWGGVVLALVIAANAHFLYLALSSQPGCADETVRTTASGELHPLRPAKEGC